MFDVVIDQLISGVTRGSLLFLMTAGLALTLGILQIPNFAHAALCVVGGYLSWTIFASLHDFVGEYAFYLAIIIGPILLSFIAVALERSCLRFLYDRRVDYQIIFTYGILLIIGDLIVFFWGSDIRTLALPSKITGGVRVFDHYISSISLILTILSFLFVFSLWILLRKTRYGITIWALMQDRTMASLLGVRVDRLTTIIFAGSIWLGGIGGTLLGAYSSLSPGSAMSFTIEVFIVVIIGGIGSVIGALIASLIIGLSQSLITLFYPELSIASMYIVMIVVLLIRPDGLLGAKQ